MNAKPNGRNTEGIDRFMLSKAATQVMKEMEENGWNQGEAELFPEVLRTKIKKNSEQLAIRKPFTTPED